MKRSRYSDEQIAFALRKAEGGTAVPDVCRQMGISEATFYVRKKKYGPRIAPRAAETAGRRAALVASAASIRLPRTRFDD